MLRTRQFACLLLLLTAFGGAAQAATPVRYRCTQVEALLARGAESTSGCSVDRAFCDERGRTTPPLVAIAVPKAYRAALPAQAPIAHAVAVHTATGLLRA